jgi:mRNA interferase MazF
MTRMNPQRGEIWLVDLNPTRGQEIQKIRPVLVVSTDLFRDIALRIIVPIASWQEKFADRPFMVKLLATSKTGLSRDSAGNVLQVRSLSTERFVRQLGQADGDQIQEILAGLVICVEYEPEI